MTEIGAKEVQIQHNLDEEFNPFSPTENVKYGTLLLDYYYQRTGSIVQALVLYNSGFAGLARYRSGGLSAVSEETQGYVKKILGLVRSSDPMFSRLPREPQRGYLQDTVDEVFYELWGVREGYEAAILGPGVPIQ